MSKNKPSSEEKVKTSKSKQQVEPTELQRQPAAAVSRQGRTASPLSPGGGSSEVMSRQPSSVLSRQPSSLLSNQPSAILQRQTLEGAESGRETVDDLPRVRLGGRTFAQFAGGSASPPPIQPKLQLGPAGDKYEQEADRVARQVVRGLAAPAPALQRSEVRRPAHAFVIPPVQRDAVDEEELQAKPNHGLEGGEVDTDVARSIQSAKGGGAPLHDGVRSSMEQGFGADFSGVRVHTGGQADALNRSLNARAFTTGNDVFFGKGEYNPGSSGGKELLAHELTHTVQQGSAPQLQPLQRHPSHAEEQEVQPMRIQRHPSHAEEQEVQAKREQRAGISGLTSPVSRGLAQRHRIQRLAVGKDDKDQPAIFSVGNVIKKLNDDYKFVETKALKREITAFHNGKRVFASWGELDSLLRERGYLLKHQDKKLRMEAKYGIPIGGASGIEQFGEKMLDTLDGLFSHLPPSHLNAMKGIMRQKEDTASFYDPNNQTLTISYARPAWLYSWGKKNTKAFGKDARQLMEEAATPVMMEGSGYSVDKDAGLGLDSRQRSTISFSRDDAFADTRIVEWTMLHEIGHAVDERIQWTTRNGADPEFGGWKTHGEQQDVAAQEEIAEAYLQDAGLSLDALAAIRISLDEAARTKIDLYTRVRNQYQNKVDRGVDVEFNSGKVKEKEDQIAELSVPKTGKDIFMSALLGTDLAKKKESAAEIASGVVDGDQRVVVEAKLNQALEKIAFAQAVPWQFPDGLASKLQVGGRIYQLDHYKTWVSYLAAARVHILSPYQFSSPGEWIAEAYAAFYGTNASARNLLTPATKSKIAEELGAPPRRGVSEAGRAKGSFEATQQGKAVLNAPKEEQEIELVSVKVAEEEYSVDEFDEDHEIIIGGPSPSSPILEATNGDEDIFASF